MKIKKVPKHSKNLFKLSPNSLANLFEEKVIPLANPIDIQELANLIRKHINIGDCGLRINGKVFKGDEK